MKEETCQSTPREHLLAMLMNPNVPKGEMEWCAVREIEELLSFVREQVLLWNADGDSGFPAYEEGKAIVNRYDNLPKLVRWCKSHHREATSIGNNGRWQCDPNLAGIMLPCEVIWKPIK